MARFEDVVRGANTLLNSTIAKLVYVGKLKPMAETAPLSEAGAPTH